MTDLTADVARSHRDAPYQMPTNTKRQRRSAQTDKARKYVADRSSAPSGVDVQEGERGGLYYETDERDSAEATRDEEGYTHYPEAQFESVRLRADIPSMFGGQDLDVFNDALIEDLPDPKGQLGGEMFERSPTAYQGQGGQQIQDELEQKRAETLADRMQLPIPDPTPELLEWADEMEKLYVEEKQPFDKAAWVQKKLVEKRVNDVKYLVDAWTWSASENPTGRMIQRAIAEEFELQHAAQPWRGMVSENLRGSHAEQVARYDEIDQKAEAEYAKEGAFARKLVRAMYEETQEFFQNHGITEVPLMRGFGLGDDEGRAPELMPDYKDDLGVDAEIDLMPGSCFTSNFDVANTFAVTVDHGATVFARVPVNRVLCTFRTGFGQMKEAETVVLGGRLQGVVVPSTGREEVMPGQHNTRNADDAAQWAKWAGVSPVNMRRVVPVRA